MENNQLEYSNEIYPKIIESANVGSSPSKIFETFSKNPGIGFLFQDSDGENLSLIHTPGLIGGNWLQAETKFVALLGFSEQTIAVKIQEASMGNTKQKVPSLGDIIQTVVSKKPLREISSLSEVFIYKNFIPIPIKLVKVFLSLSKFDPDSIAQAFLAALDSNSSATAPSSDESSDEEVSEEPIQGNDPKLSRKLSIGDDEDIDSPSEGNQEDENTPVTKISGRIPRKQKSSGKKLVSIDFLQDIADFELVFQFCYLCSKGKIKNLNYSIQPSPEIIEWKLEIENKFLNIKRSQNTLANSTSTSRRSDSIDEEEITVDSTISLRDKHMIHTLLKISENLDQNTLRLTKESEEKSKGFSKLENHKKLLLLNATESSDNENSPSDPTEFCQSFLKKTTVFRAKESLQQAIKTNKEIVFYPSTAFTTKLYTVDLLWLSPDSPSGISLFFCSESLSSDTDIGYALLDKIERSDIQKASKQTLEIPQNYSSALWMLKNLRVVLNLYFGQKSPASICLLSWINHFEINRVNYRSLQHSDPSFLTQVLYSIDRALQIYWLSCSENEERRSVNTKILQMQDLQNNIERHNFHYMIPKTLADKCSKIGEETPPKAKDNDSKRQLKETDKENFKKLKIEETLHKHWHLKSNENYTDMFWKHTSKCPKTKSGKYICMKYFIKGYCVKNCNRSHRLAPEDEKTFEEFLNHCRASDFPAGAEEP